MAALRSKFTNLVEAFDRLSRREKILVGLVGVCLFFFITSLVSIWVSARLSALERRIGDSGAKLQKMVELRGEYEKAREERQRAQQRISAARGIQLMGTLEMLAQNLGVDTKKMEMKPLAPVSSAESETEEQRVEVRLPAITIDRLVLLLEQLEQRSDSIAVRTLVIKKNFQDPTRLDANFTVSKFQLKEGKEAPAAGGGKKS
jgi:hypothetical protein